MTPPNEHTSEGGRDDRGVPYHAGTMRNRPYPVLKCSRSASGGRPRGGMKFARVGESRESDESARARARDSARARQKGRVRRPRAITWEAASTTLRLPRSKIILTACATMGADARDDCGLGLRASRVAQSRQCCANEKKNEIQFSPLLPWVWHCFLSLERSAIGLAHTHTHTLALTNFLSGLARACSDAGRSPSVSRLAPNAANRPPSLPVPTLP